jgi:hypothetical protein
MFYKTEYTVTSRTFYKNARACTSQRFRINVVNYTLLHGAGRIEKGYVRGSSQRRIGIAEIRFRRLRNAVRQCSILGSGWPIRRRKDDIADQADDA